VHSDVCDSISLNGRDGSRYLSHLLMISVDITMSTWWDISLNPLKKIKKFKVKVENQLRKKIKVFRIDRDGEYLNGGFKEYLKTHEFFHSTLLLGRLNGMIFLRKEIGSYWTWFILWLATLSYHTLFEDLYLKLQHLCWIKCHLNP
jgi:hypothetical protein